MKKVKKTPIKEAEFNKAKALQKFGLTKAQAANILGRSNTPLAYIYRADTYKEFQELNRQRFQKPHSPAEQGAASLIRITPSNPKPTEDELGRHYELMTVLESIDESLKFLVEHLPVPEKRKLFR